MGGGNAVVVAGWLLTRSRRARAGASGDAEAPDDCVGRLNPAKRGMGAKQ